nr:zinc finger, CCHC-type [Tanacetum cinerariifolium]
MLVPQGEGSGTPTESHHTPTSEASQSLQHELSSPSLPPVPTESLPTIIPSDNPPLKQYTKRARIAQSSALSPVADEPASLIGDDSQGEVYPTDSGLEADQDRANIAKTSTLPTDSTPRVTSLAADEGSMQQKLNELTALYTSLQRQQSEMISKFALQELEINRLKARIKLLEDKDRGIAEQSGDDAPNQGEEWRSLSGSHCCKVATATVSIPIGSGVVSTASPTIPTATPIFTTATESTPYTRRKGKETMVESETPKKKKTQQRKPLTRKQQREFYTSVLRNQARWKAKHFKGMTLEEIKENFDSVWKQIQDFIPVGSKKEAERFKRKGLRLEQECVKKLKTSEEVKATEEVPEEKVKEIMQLVLVEEIYVEALQVKHHIINWKHLDRDDLNKLWELVKETFSIRPAIIEWKLYDTCGVHHVTSKDKEIFMLVEKDYLLRKGLAIGMISYKLQVENYSKMPNDLILKIYKIASIPTGSDEFPLLEELPTANEDKFPLLIQSDASAEELCAAAEGKCPMITPRDAVAFNDFIARGDLHDFALRGRHFTRFNKEEALQVMIIEACNKGIFKGISLAEDGANISLLQYVVDALFFKNDYMLIACKNKAEIGSTKSLLKKEFDMKELGEANKILGMEIIRDQSRKILWVSQSGIARLVIVKFERMSKVPYANAVGSLMYLMGTANVGLVYGTNRDNHVDVTVLLIQTTLKIWIKVGEVYGPYGGCEGSYLAKGTLGRVSVELNTVAVNCDNQGVIHLLRNHVFHERTKHINVRYHFIREVLEAKTVKVLKVATEHNATDALTKVLGKVKVINGSRVVLSGIRRDNCVNSLDGHAMAGELNASVEEKDRLVQVWHKRLGHISEAGLQVQEKQGLFGKKSLGELDFLRLWVYILMFKHEGFGKFKEWKQLVENQTRRMVKKLRTDNGLEFCNQEFKQLCKTHMKNTVKFNFF